MLQLSVRAGSFAHMTKDPGRALIGRGERFSSHEGTRLALAVAVAAAAGVITHLVALISAVPSVGEPPEGIALGDALLHMSTLTAILGTPIAAATVTMTGVPVYCWARRTGRGGIGPFLWTGIIVGAIVIPLLWLAFFGVFDTVLLVVGAVVGGVSAAAFWASLWSRLRGGVEGDGRS